MPFCACVRIASRRVVNHCSVYRQRAKACLSVHLQARSQGADQRPIEGLDGRQARGRARVGQQLHDVVQQQRPEVVQPAQVVQLHLYHPRQRKQPASMR